MRNYINHSIEDQNIVDVSLLCGLDDDKDLMGELKKKVAMYEGKAKILIDCYLTFFYLVCSRDENLKLQGVRIITDVGEVYHISTHDILENKVVFSNYSLKFMLDALKSINHLDLLPIKVLDYKTLDYVDYYQKDDNVVKSKGGK